MQKRTTVSILLLIMSATLVYANYTCNFECITNNNATNIAIGQSQLHLNVTDLGNSQAAFCFTNKGTQNAVIEEILFEDGSGMLSFSNFQPFEPGVNFLVNTKNLNLPGGNDPSINFTESYGFYAEKAAPKNGIGIGESLGIALDYSDMTFDELIDSIENSLLRIGIHVIAFDNQGSESFVNCSPKIPAPSSIVLTCIGLTAIGKFRKKHT